MSPYADPIKRREYARTWERDRRKEVNNRDGSLNLSRNLITWEELDSCSFVNNIKKWEDCTSLASKYISNKKTDRIMVSSLAIQSCKIRHGGDFKTETFKSGAYGKTLRAFAVEANINYKTLSEWIRVKRFIIDKIKDRSQPIDFSSAHLAMKQNYNDEMSAFERYERIKGDVKYRESILALRYLRNCLVTVRKCGISRFSHSQREYLKSNTLELLKELESPSIKREMRVSPRRRRRRS